MTRMLVDLGKLAMRRQMVSLFLTLSQRANSTGCTYIHFVT